MLRVVPWSFWGISYKKQKITTNRHWFNVKKIRPFYNIYVRFNEVLVVNIFFLVTSSCYSQQKVSRLDSLQGHLKLEGQLEKINSNLNLTRPALQLGSDTLRKPSQPRSTKNFFFTRDTIPDSTLANQKIQTPIENAVQNTQGKLTEKLSSLQKRAASNLPVTGSKFPDLNLPDVDLPNIAVPAMPLENIDLPAANLPSADLPDIHQPSVPSLEGVKVLEEYQNHIKEATQQIGDLPKNVDALSEGKLEQLKNVPENLEKEITKLDQVEGVSDQIAEADKLKRYHDPAVAKEEALNKAKEEAVNHFAGHEEELKTVMEKLSSLKAKIPDPEGVIDLYSKRKQLLNTKPFVERFVPGLTFQIQKQQSLWLDLNPQIGFKISGRFLAGFGWNERLAYDFDNNRWDAISHVYGIRSFLHFKVKENLWLKADIETMNSPLKSSPLSSDIIGRGWVWSYFGGIKRDFKFSDKVIANVQALYNFFDPEKKSPYTNRFNVRFGFELPIKRKIQKFDSIPKS